MRRAYETLKLCVFGNVNESGVSVLTPTDAEPICERIASCSVS